MKPKQTIPLIGQMDLSVQYYRFVVDGGSRVVQSNTWILMNDFSHRKIHSTSTLCTRYGVLSTKNEHYDTTTLDDAQYL